MSEKSITQNAPTATLPINYAKLNSNIFYIKGITHSGELFRPSDWADRLCGVMTSLSLPKNSIAKQQQIYSDFAQPVILDGVRSVKVDPAIAKFEPRALQFLIQFAKDNYLEIIIE